MVAKFQPYNVFTLIPWQASDYIQSGKVNQLLVSAKGSHFLFFINGQLVGEAVDSSSSSGLVGVEADQYSTTAWDTFEFNNFKL